MDLTKAFNPHVFADALDSWAWIGLGRLTPAFTSPFGDVFFQADDGFWWLDTLEGSLTRPWQTSQALEADLNTAEGQERYLLAGLAQAAAARGLVPRADQVYGFTHPPVLGGPLEIGNVEVIDFVVSVNIAGQIHEQVRDLPEGAPIPEIKIVGD